MVTQLNRPDHDPIMQIICSQGNDCGPQILAVSTRRFTRGDLLFYLTLRFCKTQLCLARPKQNITTFAIN
jgi:hypothetical protein